MVKKKDSNSIVVTSKVDDNTNMRMQEVCNLLGVSRSKLTKVGILHVLSRLYNEDGTVNMEKMKNAKRYIIRCP